ncbi:hypothetical protein [Halopiger xanaduensis]|uniref:Uncharacterized protein n=1 Tax=Halopiger xanaduensis (strain DSM 18323 / JCM 14033 / SH-6) TaxID=797210 RepID=F8D682_HALXS|nr:hypothetical protein [Halopiger xanaduensis]AEH35328.1 hypothetical protein Halxa_0689 [Halopiger xanaduensis SH-6]
MCATFTEDDVGKTVEDSGGTKIGVVSSVEDDAALVEPDHDALESIKARPGWNLNTDETVPIEPDSVGVITGEVVRLEGERDADDPAVERGEHSVGRRSDAGSGGEDGDASEQRVGAGKPQPQVEGEAGADRHEDNEDAPPHGDRTVTRDRGEEDDR